MYNYWTGTPYVIGPLALVLVVGLFISLRLSFVLKNKSRRFNDSIIFSLSIIVVLWMMFISPVMAPGQKWFWFTVAYGALCLIPVTFLTVLVWERQSLIRALFSVHPIIAGATALRSLLFLGSVALLYVFWFMLSLTVYCFLIYFFRSVLV